MAEKKITDLTELTALQLDEDDLIFVHDDSVSILKSTKLSTLLEAKSGCRVRLASTQTVDTGVTGEKIEFATEDWDISSEYVGSPTYRFTPQTPGYYLVVVSVGAINLGDGKYISAVIKKNGTAIAAALGYSAGATNDPCVNATEIVYLNGSTDYIEGWAVHDNGSIMDITSSTDKTYMSIMWIGR